MNWCSSLASRLEDSTGCFSSWFVAVWHGFFLTQSVMVSCRVWTGFKWPRFLSGEDSFFLPALLRRVWLIVCLVRNNNSKTMQSFLYLSFLKGISFQILSLSRSSPPIMVVCLTPGIQTLHLHGMLNSSLLTYRCSSYLQAEEHWDSGLQFQDCNINEL